MNMNMKANDIEFDGLQAEPQSVDELLDDRDA
jgi:hypothetical protein